MVIRSKQKINVSKPFNIVLVEPEIPPNTGNIARPCAATSTKLHLIHPLGFKITDKELKRAGLDYWPLLDIKEYENWNVFVETLQQGVSMWYLSTRGAKNIWEAKFNPGDYLIFGSETKGLNEDILSKNNNHVISIPMNGLTRSINLSTAVGIVLYEALRQVTVEKEIFTVIPI
jgi:tRNA (cytidine/uridine-2'-O-)-methyltransferase